MSAGDQIAYPKLLVKAETWDEVASILKDEFDIIQKFDASDKKIEGFFVVRLIINTNEITQEFYDKIKQSPSVGILYEGKVGRKNRSAVLDQVENVENKLRTMLLYTSDVIENFLDLFSKEPLTKNRSRQGIISTGHIDPLMSHVTFGGMIDILSIDLSLKSRNFSVADLAVLTSKSNNFQDLKSSLAEKLNEKRVWDVIAETLLAEPVKWSVVEGDLKILKTHRNVAAHSRSITYQDLNEVKVITKRLNKVLKFKNPAPLSDAEKEAMRVLFDSIYERIQEPSKIRGNFMGDYNRPDNDFLSGAVGSNLSPLRRLLGDSLDSKSRNKGDD